MIRKISHIILSLLLLVSTIGLVVSKHYCGGEIVSISVNHETKSCCDMDGCCSTETHTYQIKDNYSSPAFTAIPVLAELDILGHNLFETEGMLETEAENPTPFITDFSPPKTIQTVLSIKQLYLL